MFFPAYRVTRADGADELVPFTPLAQAPPPGYLGDWRVEAFTDAAIKQQWRETANDPIQRERILARVANMEIPHQFRATGKLDPRGLIDSHGEVDLGAIRRPAFFGAAPWRKRSPNWTSGRAWSNFRRRARPTKLFTWG